MKKNKHKAAVKESKKFIKKEIENHLVAALRVIAINFAEKPMKLEKWISKNAKQLAKKLAKNMKSNSPNALAHTNLANDGIKTNGIDIANSKA